MRHQGRRESSRRALTNRRSEFREASFFTHRLKFVGSPYCGFDLFEQFTIHAGRGKLGFFFHRAGSLVWFGFFYADVYEALRNTRLDGK